MQVPKSEYVEFTYDGNTVKFAKMNLGATTVAESHETSNGDYYAWGAIEPFGTVDYITNTVTPTEGHDGGYCEANVPAEFTDVVTVKKGTGWRMPTTNDFRTLIGACGFSVENNNQIEPPYIFSCEHYEKGIYRISSSDPVIVGGDTYKTNGVLFVQDADHHVFFPTTGEINGTNLTKNNQESVVWTSEPSPTYSSYAVAFFSLRYVQLSYGYKRNVGLPVRPVFTN